VTVVVDTRADLTLDALRRVAWEGEPVELASEAVERMDACHRDFAAYVEARLAEDPAALIYGVTSAPGDGAGTPLSAEARARRPRGLWTAASFGEPLPERVVRAIAFARLADLVGGHAGVRAEVGLAVAALLAGDRLPVVPARGNGGAGEILALGHLFGELAGRLGLQGKEAMALINGSPSASALVADAALAGRGRLELAEHVLALSAEALRAPLESYAPELEGLWGDQHEAGALRSLRGLLEGGTAERQAHQGAVSLRVLPRVLGRAREAQAHAEGTAARSLASVTTNPVFVPPHEAPPLGIVLSNGGFHNGRAAPALDGLTLAWADLAQLAQRNVDKLFQHPATAPLLAAEEWTTKPLHMVAVGFAEDARHAAQPTVLPLAGFGQNDLPSPTFPAWRKATEAGRCLEGVLAVLAAVASQALHAAGAAPPPALAGLLEEVREAFPPVDEPRALGPDGERLAAAFAQRAVPSAALATGS
jgi:histidine ammonia-lyase